MKILTDDNSLFMKVYFATVAAVGFVVIVINLFFLEDYRELKESCLQRSETTVEYSEGKFERCLER